MSLGTIISAATSVATTVNSIIQGNKNQKDQLALQQQQQQFSQAISGLNNQQQYALQLQVNAAQTDTQKMAIMTDAIAKIKAQQVSNAGNSNQQQTFTIIALAVVLIVVVMVFKKSS